jgi:hypothetical protein
MQPSSHKPKSTIVPAAPGTLTADGLTVVAWEICDGQIVKAITFNPALPVVHSQQRGADE